MPYVYSKAASDCKYPINEDIKIIKEAVAKGKVLPSRKMLLINGGAGVINKHFETPQGVVTKVSDYEAAQLRKCTVFMRKMERGFLTIEDKEQSVDKVVSNMTDRDKSDQFNENDFAEGEAPISNAKETKKSTGTNKTKKKV